MMQDARRSAKGGALEPEPGVNTKVTGLLALPGFWHAVEAVVVAWYIGLDVYQWRRDRSYIRVAKGKNPSYYLLLLGHITMKAVGGA